MNQMRTSCRPLTQLGLTRAGAKSRNHFLPILGRSSSSAPVPQDGTYIKGTVNDPVTFPKPSKTHGSYHWTFERSLSAALVPIVGSSMLVSASPVLDGVLAISLVLHSHMGFDQCFTDYLHERKFPIAGPITKWGLRAATVATLVGVYQFNTNDIGLTELVVKAWHA